MRLTRETLIKIARDAAEQRARVSRRIICIYLVGSVLSDSPLLGGTTDIDLVIIHDSEPAKEREMVRLNDDVHLDISHYAQSVFHQPRHLRSDPWLGPFIYNKPTVFHDTQHWFDFLQASTGAQFLQPDYVYQRARALYQAARQDWLDLEMQAAPNHARRVYGYLRVLENAGNALASLHGPPLTERRFLVNLPHRLQQFHQSDLTAGFIHLFTPDPSQLETGWAAWLPEWKESFQQASALENAPARLQPCRQPYYERAVVALWDESPTASAWLLLRTWALAISHQGHAPAQQWQNALQTLRLDEDGFSTRLQDMDHFLDRVEETMDTWAQSNGLL